MVGVCQKEFQLLAPPTLRVERATKALGEGETNRSDVGSNFSEGFLDGFRFLAVRLRPNPRRRETRLSIHAEKPGRALRSPPAVQPVGRAVC
jgi:hypothetical protein